jgi:L-glyceraldehyde 3-phosphate reductase
MIGQLHTHARERGQTLAQMALAWVLRDEGVTSALIGASTPEQIRENVAATRNTTFTTDELKRLAEIVRQVDLPENPWPRE